MHTLYKDNWIQFRSAFGNLKKKKKKGRKRRRRKRIKEEKEKEEEKEEEEKKKKKKRRKRRREFDVECTLHVSHKDENFFFLFIVIFKLLKFYDNFIKFIIYNFVYVLWTYIVLCVDQTPSNLWYIIKREKYKEI